MNTRLHTYQGFILALTHDQRPVQGQQTRLLWSTHERIHTHLLSFSVFVHADESLCIGQGRDCMHVCIYMYMRVCTCMYMRVCICMYMRVCVCVCIDGYECI